MRRRRTWRRLSARRRSICSVGAVSPLTATQYAADVPNPAELYGSQMTTSRANEVARRPYGRRTVAIGFKPFAIASIVSFESRSSSEFTTQYVPRGVRSTTMCRCAPW